MSRIAQLERVDWSFPSTGTTARTVHAGRMFPGNFIPQIPAHLIGALSNPHDTVFDPFSGSGTTAVEALNLGRHAICSDLISASVNISAGKVESFLSPIGEEVRYEFLSALAWSHLCETSVCGELGEGSATELERWIGPSTLAKLRFIWRLIEKQPRSVRGSLELVFADVLFGCASTGNSLTASGLVRRHHWGWIADNVYPGSLVEHDPIESFLKKMRALPAGLPGSRTLGCSHLVVQQDARSLGIASSSIDLVVTSPPYVGMIDYARANRILYLWYGWNIDFEETLEIGARYKRFRKSAQQQYLAEIDVCWQEISRVLKSGGYAALIVGESRKFLGTVDCAIRQMEEYMPKVWGPVRRVPSRRRVADRNAQESAEYVCVFQKT